MMFYDEIASLLMRLDVKSNTSLIYFLKKIFLDADTLFKNSQNQVVF